jgi:hypothetical protein
MIRRIRNFFESADGKNNVSFCETRLVSLRKNHEKLLEKHRGLLLRRREMAIQDVARQIKHSNEECFFWGRKCKKVK